MPEIYGPHNIETQERNPIQCILTRNKMINESCNSRATHRYHPQLWHKKQVPNTENVAVTPVFSATRKKIYYTTYFSLYRDSGIYSYDVLRDKHECVKLYKEISNMKYFPTFYASCFTQDTIYFVGGDEPYDGLAVYNLQTGHIERIEFDEHIGCNPALTCTNNDIDCKKLVSGFVRLSEREHDIFVPVSMSKLIALFSNNDNLHIVGGERNNKHWLWNAKIRSLELIHEFEEYPTGIRGQSLLYSDKRNMMYMLGGCNEDSEHYKDVWCYGTIWRKLTHWELPTAMCGFGAVLYDHRVILIFGGRSSYSNPLDTIYYLDISKPGTTWKEVDIKCSSKGCCNAVLVRNESYVHVLPFGNYNRHIAISVHVLLPQSLLKKSHRGLML